MIISEFNMESRLLKNTLPGHNGSLVMSVRVEMEENACPF